MSVRVYFCVFKQDNLDFDEIIYLSIYLSIYLRCDVLWITFIASSEVGVVMSSHCLSVSLSVG